MQLVERFGRRTVDPREHDEDGDKVSDLFRSATLDFGEPAMRGPHCRDQIRALTGLVGPARHVEEPFVERVPDVGTDRSLTPQIGVRAGQEGPGPLECGEHRLEIVIGAGETIE